MDVATRAKNEIADLHRFFQDWFRGLVPHTEAEFARAKKAWAEPFTLVDPNNDIWRSQQLLATAFAQHGQFPSLAIRIKHLGTTYGRDNGIVIVTYEEWHTDGDARDGRLCSAVLSDVSITPSKCRWLYIHESAISSDK